MTIEQRNAQIIKFYTQGYSLREIAPRYGISRSRIHQILRKECPHLLRGHNRMNHKGRPA